MLIYQGLQATVTRLHLNVLIDRVKLKKGIMKMPVFNQSKKIPLQKLAVVILSMADGQVIYSDGQAYVGVQGNKTFLAKEFKNQVNDILKYDGNTLINPNQCVCARPMMKLVDMNPGDDK